MPTYRASWFASYARHTPRSHISHLNQMRNAPIPHVSHLNHMWDACYRSSVPYVKCETRIIGAWYQSLPFSKFSFLIVETEILPPKMKIGPSGNWQFWFDFRFNRSNRNSTKMELYVFLSINMGNKWIISKLNQVHKCHQIANCIIVNSHSNTSS
jgi:hypothetical protein